MSEPALAALLFNTVNEVSPNIVSADKIIDSTFELAEVAVVYDPIKAIKIMQQLANLQNQKISNNYLFYLYIINLELFINRCDFVSAEFIMNELFELFRHLNDPYLFSKAISYKN